MKKIILSIAAVFAFGFANAQETVSEGFSSGDVFITGTVGFGSSKSGDSKRTSFQFSPSVGYFVNSNIAVGARLGIFNIKDETKGLDDVKSTSFTGGLFGRYYWNPASKFSIFGELGANYVTTKYENTPTDYKTDGFQVEFAPGISYFLNKNFAIEATWGVISYASAKPDLDSSESTDTFSVGLNLSDVNFGVIYKF